MRAAVTWKRVPSVISIWIHDEAEEKACSLQEQHRPNLIGPEKKRRYDLRSWSWVVQRAVGMFYVPELKNRLRFSTYWPIFLAGLLAV